MSWWMICLAVALPLPVSIHAFLYAPPVGDAFATKRTRTIRASTSAFNDAVTARLFDCRCSATSRVVALPVTRPLVRVKSPIRLRCWLSFNFVVMVSSYTHTQGFGQAPPTSPQPPRPPTDTAADPKRPSEAK